MHTNESESRNNYLSDLKVIYVVGNSRSGTTMLSRILNNHSRVYSLPELHYFERYDVHQESSKEKLIDAIIYLLRIIHKGYFDQSPSTEFREEAEKVYAVYSPDSLGAVYSSVLHHISTCNKAEYICEQTPQNIFYRREIQAIIPNSYFIHIVRDPRDVLLSQKRKWKRASQGADFIPPKETIRAYFNYHPYTISKIWNAVERKAIQDKLFTVRYEDVIAQPEKSIAAICDVCGIAYEAGMEQVKITGSSSTKDTGELGLNKERLYAWKRGGLDSSELFICRRINDRLMQHWNYESHSVFPNPFYLLYDVIYFPIHIGVALLLNLSRQRNLWSAIKRRLQR